MHFDFPSAYDPVQSGVLPEDAVSFSLCVTDDAFHRYVIALRDFEASASMEHRNLMYRRHAAWIDACDEIKNLEDAAIYF